MKNKLLLLMTIIFIVISPVVVFAEGGANGRDTVNIGDIVDADPVTPTSNIFSWVLTDLNLSIGDFINNLITEVVGQKVTIQGLIFDEVDSVNPNFFSNSVKGTKSHLTVKKQIQKWYPIFQEMAISFYLAGLLFMGLKIMLSESPLSNSGVKEVAVHWISGLAILLLFNIVMKYAFDVNEAFVGLLRSEFAPSGKATGTTLGDPDEYSKISLELRSPDYRSKYTGILSFGGEQLNNAYVEKLDDYRSTADLMRIMRAYAGASKRLIFCIIWFVMLFQLIVLLFKYYKRYFTIALLITIFPFTTISYLIDRIKGRTPEAFRMWCVEFFVNVFTQSIHAIVYSIIASVCINKVAEEFTGSGGGISNWIIIIVATDFLFRGEKIARKILGADGAKSARSMDESAKAGKGGFGKVKANFGSFFRIFRGGRA